MYDVLSTPPKNIQTLVLIPNTTPIIIALLKIGLNSTNVKKSLNKCLVAKLTRDPNFDDIGFATKENMNPKK